MTKVVISSGHGLHVPGASDLIDEVTEARRVVDRVAQFLGNQAIVFHDDISTDQQSNLETIVAAHNREQRDLDVSVHFNASEPTAEGVGTEVWYVTAAELAGDMAAAIAGASGLKNRGAKFSDDLYFLNMTEPTELGAILIEVCFVDSTEDTELYKSRFQSICRAIARVIEDAGVMLPDEAVSRWLGRCSSFGGPYDTGVDPDEDLAWWEDAEDAEANPDLFLPEQPSNTTGLARRLDPESYYVAVRWDYDETPKTMLADPAYRARVRNVRTGKSELARPADWGPSEEQTGRVADLSPGLMVALGLETDDEVEVTYPVPVETV